MKCHFVVNRHIDALVGHYDLSNLFSTGTVVVGGPGSWRAVSVVGVVAAVLLMIIRGRVLESGRFNAVVQPPPDGERGAHDRGRRQVVHALRPDPAVQPTEPVQHDRWPPGNRIMRATASPISST